MAKFEEALKGLEKSAQDLKKEGNTLDEALKAYEEGMKIQIYKRK